METITIKDETTGKEKKLSFLSVKAKIIATANIFERAERKGLAFDFYPRTRPEDIQVIIIKSKDKGKEE